MRPRVHVSRRSALRPCTASIQAHGLCEQFCVQKCLKQACGSASRGKMPNGALEHLCVSAGMCKEAPSIMILRLLTMLCTCRLDSIRPK